MSRTLSLNGQWVDLMPVGKHADSVGRHHEITAEFLEAVVSNYDPTLHEAPAVVGHPRDDAPAYGWVSALRISDDKPQTLQAQFADIDPDFEELNRTGRFKKRSASFYTDAGTAPGGQAPYLRHVGFLGAQPPAIKGLRPIHFSEGDAVTFEVNDFSEGEHRMDEKEVNGVVERVTEGVKAYFAGMFGGKAETQPANFSEREVQALIEKAVGAVKTEFGEKLTEVEKENKRLLEAVNRQAGATTRSEITAFCERLGAGRIPPAFKRAGIVEFMESLAAVPSEQKVTVINFIEDDKGNRTETRTEQTPLAWFQSFVSNLKPFIEFGEQFGGIEERGGGDDIVDPARRQKLREEMGLETKEVVK